MTESTRIIARVLLCALIVFVQAKSVAYEINPVSFLKEIKVINSQQLSYQYQVFLLNATTREVLDSVSGKYYRVDTKTLDSNTGQITVWDHDFALQIDQRAKQIYAQNIRTIEKQTGRKQTGVLPDYLNLQELYLKKAAVFKFTIDRAGNTLIDISLKGSATESLVAVVDKDKNLVSITMRTYSQVDKTRLERLLVMHHFSSQVDKQQISSKRFISGSSKDLKPVGKYGHYKLISLI